MPSGRRMQTLLQGKQSSGVRWARCVCGLTCLGLSREACWGFKAAKHCIMLNYTAGNRAGLRCNPCQGRGTACTRHGQSHS